MIRTITGKMFEHISTASFNSARAAVCSSSSINSQGNTACPPLAAAKPKPSTPIPKKRKLYRPSGSVEFASARGKTVEQVYMTAYEDVNSVTLSFTDHTELVVEVDPCLAFSADYSDWTTGNQRVLKRWPRLRSG